MSKKQNLASVYFFGGTGTNLAISSNVPTFEESDGAFANFNKVIVDTSRANIQGHEEELEQRGVAVHVIPGLDGCGKSHKTAAQHTAPHIKGILNDYKPSEVNILVASAAGASGPVLLRQVVGEIASRGKALAVILVANVTSSLEAANTMSTIQGIQRTAEKYGCTIPISYWQNAAAADADKPWLGTFTSNNTNIDKALRAMAVFTSGTVAHMDSEDVINTLDIRRTNKRITAQAVELIIRPSKDEALDAYIGKTLTSASCMRNVDDLQPALRALYESVGYYAKGIHFNSDEADEGMPDLTMITTPANLPVIMADLEEERKIFKGIEESLSGNGAITTSLDDDDDDLGID